MATSPLRGRVVAIATFGLATALAVVAAAIPTVIEPRLLQLPLDVRSSSEAVGTATLVDAAVLARDRTLVSNQVPIRATQRISVIGSSADGTMTVQTAHRLSRDDIDDPHRSTVTAAVTQITVDRRTGYPAPGTEAKIYNRQDTPAVSLAIDGLSFKFPFYTKQHSYRFFDHTAYNSYAMEFQSVEEIDGLPVYHFRSETPEVRMGAPLSLPAEYFGGVEGDTVEVHRYYTATRDLRVEPTTGMIVGAHQTARQYVAASPESEPRVTLVDIDAGWAPGTSAEQLDEARKTKAMIQWGLHRAPWLLGLAAAAILALGVLGLIRTR